MKLLPDRAQIKTNSIMAGKQDVAEHPNEIAQDAIWSSIATSIAVANHRLIKFGDGANHCCYLDGEVDSGLFLSWWEGQHEQWEVCNLFE